MNILRFSTNHLLRNTQLLVAICTVWFPLILMAPLVSYPHYTIFYCPIFSTAFRNATKMSANTRINNKKYQLFSSLENNWYSTSSLYLIVYSLIYSLDFSHPLPSKHLHLKSIFGFKSAFVLVFLNFLN